MKTFSRRYIDILLTSKVGYSSYRGTERWWTLKIISFSIDVLKIKYEKKTTFGLFIIWFHAVASRYSTMLKYFFLLRVKREDLIFKNNKKINFPF